MYRNPSRTVRFGGQLPLAPAWLSLLLTVAVIGGCGDNVSTLPSVTTHPVKGKVLLPDGAPLSEGVVTFVPVKETGRQAVGKLNSDGTFSLTTQKPDDGAAEGEYRVAIDSDLASGVVDNKGRKKAALPEKYRDDASSNLTATIKSGENNLPPFQLDNKAAEKGKGAGKFGGSKRDRD
jgi:hypothetical protein